MEHGGWIPPTWEDVLDVPGERPVQGGVDEHHDDGQGEGVALVLLRTPVHVGPLNPNALLLVFGKVFAAVAESHTREDALESGNTKEEGLNSQRPLESASFSANIKTNQTVKHVCSMLTR